MNVKKHLSFTSLRKFVSSEICIWRDPRRRNSTHYLVHDAVMSAFACMYFQDPSLLQFQQQMEEESQQNNLRTLFGVKDIPKTNALKEILDDQDSEGFNPIFKGIVQRLQRGKQLDQFNMMQWLSAYDQLHEHRGSDKRGRTILYQWMNNIPLHGEKNAICVNYFCKKVLTTGPNGEEKVCRTESWVTDLEINRDNVVESDALPLLSVSGHRRACLSGKSVKNTILSLDLGYSLLSQAILKSFLHREGNFFDLFGEKFSHR